MEFLFAGSRPYALADAPYFRESFDVSTGDAREFGLDERSAWQPSWVVALATTSHFDDAFSRRVEENELAAKRHLASASPALRAANAPAMMIFRAFKPWIQKRTYEVDRQLMLLQRREALSESLIRALIADSDEQARRLEHLQYKTDRAWKRIWMKRPKF